MRYITKILESKFAVPLLILGAVIVRLPKLFSGLNEEYAFRQTQTAFVARSFLNNGIDLLTTVLPVFGRQSQVPFEFPLFQAIVAFVSPTESFVEPIGRTLSLAFFIATGVILVLLINRFLNKSASSLFLAWYLFSPFSLQWGSAFLIENLAVLFGVSSSYLFYSAVHEEKSKLLPIASILMAGSFLVKSTTAPVYCLFAFALITIRPRGMWWSDIRSSLTIFAKLTALVLPGLLVAYSWTRYSDQIKSQSLLTEKLTSSALTFWNFGTLEQRFQAETYLPILNRVLQEILGPAGVVLVIVGLTISLKRHRLEVPLLVLTAASGPLIFLNLYYVHAYYLSAVYPILIAATIWSISIFFDQVRKPNQLPLVAGALIALQIISYPFMPLARNDVRLLTARIEPPEVSRAIEKYTTDADSIILIGCDWDPTYLYYANRNGLMLPEWMFPKGKSEIANAITEFANDATKLVFCRTVEDPKSFIPRSFQIKEIESKDYAIFDITRVR